MAINKRIKKIKDAIYYSFLNKKFKKMAEESENNHKQQVWLISERGFDAQDNGYHLYKHLILNKIPGIIPVYVMDENSSDLVKVKKLGGYLVKKGSKEHFYLMYRADALISTHTYGYTPDKDIYYRLAQKDLFNPNGVNVFLSHGVTDKDMKWLYRENFKPDMFVTSCKNETRMVTSKYKQPENVVEPIGLCRYDALYETPKPEKQILIMPTWRIWLNDLSDEEFLKSDFYMFWSDLLDEYLVINTLIENGYKIVLYLHPELKKRVHLFTFKNILIRENELQDLMIESEMLITDYSSVFSDMAYIGRKIIFYQFDKDRYAKEHYQGLITKYEKFGKIIGPFTNDISGVILKTLKNPNVADKKYIKEQYFINHDNKCCERTVEAIKKRVNFQ